jgi:hypothetical protein
VCDAKGEADRRIGEWHDGGEYGEPPNLMIQVRYPRQENQHNAEEDHVGVAGALAGDFMASLVEAPGPDDGLYADGAGDGVADGDGDFDEVGVRPCVDGTIWLGNM